MRIVSLPPAEEEKEITCAGCHCVLAYTQSDTYVMHGLTGDLIRVTCPYCGRELQVDYIPYSTPPKELEFWY